MAVWDCYEEGREMKETARTAGGGGGRHVLSVWLTSFVLGSQGVSVFSLSAQPACQGHWEERPGGCEETKLGQSDFLAMFT